VRITFVLPYAGLAGGIRGIAQYSGRLRQRGHEVLVVSTPKLRATLGDRLLSCLTGNGWQRDPVSGPSHLDNVDVSHKIIDRFRPVTDEDVPEADVVVATWWVTARWVAKLSASKGAKAYFMQDYGMDGQELRRIIPTWSLPLHILTISPWLVDLIQSHCPGTAVSLIPYAVDQEVFYAPPRGKQELPTIGLAYRRRWSKGTDIALNAVRIARRMVPSLQLVAYGPERPGRPLPLPANTSYKCQATDEEIRQIYASCDAWLFASRLEGFGLPTLEAMACRAPVIGTPAGAAPELLANGAGILVGPESPGEMAGAIEQLCMLSDSQWRAISDAAYAKATSYTLDEATDLFEEALQVAVERSERDG
jgi:glycosyltransferase involved in cell wall biosynthesis